MGVFSSMNGESWFGVDSIESERSGFTISQYQPLPNTAPKLPPQSCRRETLPERLERVEGPPHGLLQIPRGLPAPTPTTRGHDLPEHRVGGVAATIIPDRPADVLRDRVYAGEKLVHVAGVGVGVFPK